MAIYNIFDYYEREQAAKGGADIGPKIDPNAFVSNHIDQEFQGNSPQKSSFFSALAARFFFFLLLLADLMWGVYSVLMLVVKLSLAMITFFHWKAIKRSFKRSWLNLKRSIVCAIALLVALFSPALGIMFSCMYFLMYDKEGVDEVVPASLREQFRALFP